MKFRYVAAAALAVAFAPVAVTAGTLDSIKQRGQLLCGSNTGLAGFGLPNEKGEWVGLDVDFCRAIAAAIFNDATKVKFIPLSA